MKRIFLILIMALSAFNAAAQLADSSFYAKMVLRKYKLETQKTRFSVQLKTSPPFGEMNRITPEKIDFYQDGELYEEANFIDLGISMNMLNIIAEPKFDFSAGKTSSIFIKAPVSFAFSLTSPGIDVFSKTWGKFSCNLPVMVGFSKNLNAISSIPRKNGYSFSVGYQIIYGPLAGATRDPVGFPFYEPRRKWAMPLVGFDYNWLNKKNKIKGLSATFSPTHMYFQVSYSFAHFTFGKG